MRTDIAHYVVFLLDDMMPLIYSTDAKYVSELGLNYDVYHMRVLNG
jgi:hypothetical protein